MYRLSVGTLPDVVLPEPPPPSEGLYTDQEITDMINNDDFIPVATADELDALRTATTQTMGAGTIWEGQYLTGLDKKYVQVDDLDLVGYANWVPIGRDDTWQGIYDGNELNVINMSITTIQARNGLFNAIDIDAICKNVKIQGTISTSHNNGGLLAGTNAGTIINCHATGTVTSSANFAGVLVGENRQIDIQFISIIENCTTVGSVSGVQEIGGICGVSVGQVIDSTNNATVTATQIRIGGITGFSTNSISGCENNGNVYSDQSVVGGICGENTGNVENTTNNGDVSNKSTGAFARIGGICGYMPTTGNILLSKNFGNVLHESGKLYAGGLCGDSRGGSTIKKSGNHGNVESNGQYTGGITGFNFQAGGLVQNCYNQGDVIGNDYVSGGVAYQYTASGTVATENCYSSGNVTGTTNVAGFCAWLRTGTITNSYYDSQTSGQSDTGKGLPRTTLQMQQGTADSFILPAGGEDTGEDAANAMYTGWSVAIWKFTPITEYPTLL